MFFFRLSVISSLLRPTWVEVDLDAVNHNVHKIKQLIGKEVHLMAVVKANAYGHGIIEIARTSLAAGSTWLGVATLEEALLLRRELTKDIPILVLGYVPVQHVPKASRSKITVTGISLAWVQQAARILHDPFDFHLKIDTGLNRLGCQTLDEVKEVLKIVSNHSHVNLTGVFTHFATATDMENTSYFDWQLSRFHDFLDIIPNRTQKVIHCANSGATLLHGKHVFFNMVRCGAALTGTIRESALDHLLPIPIRTALSVHSVLDLVKMVNDSEKIGYSGTYTTTGTEWIGTVPIGYADGWHKNFKPTGVLVDGKKFPIVGRIAMDQLMIRLDRNYSLGTRVTFIGQQGNETITIDEVAAQADMIKEEILCSLTVRTQRIYKSSVSFDSSATKPFKRISFVIFLALVQFM